MSRSATTVSILLLFSGGLIVAASDERTHWPRVTTKKPEDRVELVAAKGIAAFTVTSPSGIGSANITVPSGKWPDVVILRLRLKGLESLRISNGDVTLGASASAEGDGSQRLFVQEGDREKPVDKGDPFWTTIRRSNAGVQQFEIKLPGALFKGQVKTLTISWIDFYRG